MKVGEEGRGLFDGGGKENVIRIAGEVFRA